MKRLALWSIEVVLVFACSRAAAWEPYPPGSAPNSKSNPAAEWFAGPEKAAPHPATKAAKAPAKVTTPMAETPAPAAKPATVMDEGISTREQELQTLLRRQKVCFQLMQIALETNDTELLRKAEQLDERARNLYSERTAALAGFGDEGSNADVKMLDRQLGSTRTAGRESAPRAAAKPRDTHSVTEARSWED